MMDPHLARHLWWNVVVTNRAELVAMVCVGVLIGALYWLHREWEMRP